MLLTLLLAFVQAAAPTMESIAQGRTSNIEETRQAIVRTEAEWEALWKLHAAPQSPPPVDFATSMVAAVFLGTRPTGGYSVAITGTRRDGDTLVVEFAERRPAPDAILTQALTSPFHIVKLPRHEGAVVFRSTPSAPALR